jgi:hypothetical protein
VVPISVPIITISVTVTVSVPIAVVFLLTNLAFADVAIMVTFAFPRAKIAFALGGPGVIAVYAAVLSFPIALKEPLSIVTGHDPVSSDVRRPSPITIVPFVVVSNRVPIALDPEKVGPGACRAEVNDTRRRRGTNSDSNRHLRECRQGEKQSRSEQACSQKSLTLCGIHRLRIPP